jgi:hypothetical protein
MAWMRKPPGIRTDALGVEGGVSLLSLTPASLQTSDCGGVGGAGPKASAEYARTTHAWDG